MIVQNKFVYWLRNLPSENASKKYRHRLFTEYPNEREEILEELTSYVQNAHEDARGYLRSIFENPLDPFSMPSSFDPTEGYPELLHMNTLKGYFGEIFAGLIAEHFAPFDETDWRVPVFFFRYHSVAFQELERIRQTEGTAEDVPGRTGDDCLAFLLNSDGQIIRYLYCEAKCTSGRPKKEKIAEAHQKVCDSVPVDFMQAVYILQQKNDAISHQWARAIQKLSLVMYMRLKYKIERCDMVVYVCGQSPVRGERSAWLSTDKPHEAYTANRRLEAIEIHLPEVEELIRRVYRRKPVIEVPPSLDSTIGMRSTMSSPDEIVALAKKLRETLAGTNLPPPLAKLYSQYTRLCADQPGLLNWQEKETVGRLNDALGLLEAAFIERDADSEKWHESARRAGTLLEWLSHPQLNPKGLPLHFLAAAAYQLAGYPALSSGLLSDGKRDTTESHILYFLLKADFPNLLEQLTTYWAENIDLAQYLEMDLPWQNAEELSSKLQQQVTKQTTSALGILYAAMRWGESARISQALGKLSAIGEFFLHGTDPYSWLLARLCAEVAKVYVQSSLRGYVSNLSQGINETGKRTIERYLRQRFQQNKTLAWSSQITGIKRLENEESFVLCTPTGSGKTTVAELAILQSLFLDRNPPISDDLSSENIARIVLYLVPSRALAAEVEASLSHVLHNLNEPPINITGLYGGTDWGPTDVWLTSGEQTVLICTYEKAEALIRFLTLDFLKRVSLVVVDEAHSVQFDENIIDLRKAESRSLRLESLGTRLFTYLDENKGRTIALSAVASNMQDTLAHWVTGNKNASPAETLYRSTRQLIGRLECHADRSFMIHYDLLDGADLQFDKKNSVGSTYAESPYIIKPFDSCPPSDTEWENGKVGPEKRLRPYLLWAAMQLASQYHQGTYGAVLISVTQDINYIAKDFLFLLDNVWASVKKPVFFLPPQDKEKKDLWQKCLRSCEDYFGKQSHEYQLLEKGIVIHHGKMPGLMARLLIQIVQERIVHIVLATSTLSEGVNLPVETILIPSLLRAGKSISSHEFSNLIGRVGRPGVGTEGRSLVLLEDEQERDWDKTSKIQKARQRYDDLIKDIKEQAEATDNRKGARSPLAVLLQDLKAQWDRHFSNTHLDFFEWLEKVSPIEENLKEETGLLAIESIDALDNMLLATITELEQINEELLTASQLEDKLRQIWQRSYAYHAVQEEKYLSEIFVRRGKALWSTIYPDATQRRHLYLTSLPPRSGNELLVLYPRIIEELKKEGEEYASWRDNTDKRFEFVEKIVGLLGTLTKFKLENKKIGKQEVQWQDILRWWLDPASGIAPQNASDISEWYNYVYQNFGYKICWGLGSILALAGEDAHGGIVMESTFENWPLMQLPWVALWLKELLTWGTLEPVAAYLLAKNIKSTRKDAEEAADIYYMSEYHPYPDELLNVAKIRNWADIQYRPNKPSSFKKPPELIPVTLLRDFANITSTQWRTIPVEREDKIYWCDVSGYPFAFSQKTTDWEARFPNDYDFVLDTATSVVSSTPYL